ncbi:MAG: VWA domain-containing protein [Treponema sp.]|nr:VWA domain-containing protein [Treponema sp.]
MNFGFSRPLLLLLVLISAAAALLIFFRFRKPFCLYLPLGSPGGASFKPPFRAGILMKILSILEAAAVLFLCIAVAGPEMRERETLWLDRGADIIFVLDISPSMAGLDMKGRRLDAARELVRSFALSRASDAIGLAAVGNEAALVCPPTTDRESFFAALDRLQIGELGDGTALGMGLSLASLHLSGSKASRRITVLITDGENNAGSIHPETAAGFLREMGVRLWVIAVGSAGEVPIDYVDPATRMRRTGTFLSRFDDTSLKSLAAAAGGYYINASSAETLKNAFAQLDEREMIVRRSASRIRVKPFHRPFLVSALILFALVLLFRRGFLSSLRWYPSRAFFLSGICGFLFAACVFIALAEPHWGYRGLREIHHGLDCIIAVDLSKSMEGRDMDKGEKSRLEKGLDILREILPVLENRRFGVVIGKGRGMSVIPLSSDTEAVLSFLDSLSPASISGRGTNLETLIDAALRSFMPSSPGFPVILLLSDGEELTGSLAEAGNRAFLSGVHIAALGLGSEEGIELHDGENGKVISRLRRDPLQKTAMDTGGIYISGNEEAGETELLRWLMEKGEKTQISERREKQPRWQLFVLAALLFFAVSKFALSGRKNTVSGRKNSARAAVSIVSIVSLFLLGSCDAVRGGLLIMEGNFYSGRGMNEEAVSAFTQALNHERASPYAQYGIGTAYLNMNDTEDALEQFALVEKETKPNTHMELRYRNAYNAGVARFAEGDYAEAASAFRKALEADPSRFEAKRNLELSLRSLAEENSGAAQDAERDTAENSGSKAFFDYLREKEQEKWRSREWDEEGEEEGADY